MHGCLIMPTHTEVGALSETLATAAGVQTVSPGEPIDRSADTIWIDLSFDVYHRDVSAGFLYAELGRIATMLEHHDTRDLQVFALRGYPFRSNARALLFRQRIIADFCHALTEFHNASTVHVPTVISRQCFHSVQNPCVSIINAVRQDTGMKIGLREDSRFRLVYEMDLLGAMTSGDFRPGTVPLVVEGVEMSLKDIYEGAVRAAGNTPITYDARGFVHYDYPEGNFDSVSHVRYSFGDMMVDLISYLF